MNEFFPLSTDELIKNYAFSIMIPSIKFTDNEGNTISCHTLLPEFYSKRPHELLRYTIILSNQMDYRGNSQDVIVGYVIASEEKENSKKVAPPGFSKSRDFISYTGENLELWVPDGMEDRFTISNVSPYYKGLHMDLDFMNIFLPKITKKNNNEERKKFERDDKRTSSVKKLRKYKNMSRNNRFRRRRRWFIVSPFR